MDAVECVCHEDCEYCGKIGTVTTVVSRSEQNYSGSFKPKELDPHPHDAIRGPCSNCGYYSAVPIQYAYPVPIEDEPSDGS